MARAVELTWPEVEISGVVSTRYQHAVPCEHVRIIEAGHPIPDGNSIAAADAMLALLEDTGPDDLVLALMSGGGSACLEKPQAGISLAEMQDTTNALLKSGASISDMNTVRQQLSAIKGGKLAAAAAPATLVTLVISDVPGDDPSLVASGPTIQTSSTPAAALAILDRLHIELPSQVRNLLATNVTERRMPSSENCTVIASPMMALEKIAEMATASACDIRILGDELEGEASELATQIAAECVDAAKARDRNRPLVLISGGETTVTLPADCNANGGRNTEFQLALALALKGIPNVWTLAGDSDGIDGKSNAAGAIVTPTTLTDSRVKEVDPAMLLAQHRSYSFFEALGDLVVTGPTRTNVNDLRIQLIL